MNRIAFSLLGPAFALTFAFCARGASVVTTSTIDGGGQHATSANYTMDNSIGGIGGISSASADLARKETL